ncbi:MAG: YgaP family membrane protein [Pseudomonadota bacterium]
MTPNMGTIDKWLRIVVGILLIALAIFGVIGWWGYIGIIPLATGLVNFCPVYRLIGMNTRDKGTGEGG